MTIKAAVTLGKEAVFCNYEFADVAAVRRQNFGEGVSSIRLTEKMDDGWTLMLALQDVGYWNGMVALDRVKGNDFSSRFLHIDSGHSRAEVFNRLLDVFERRPWET